MNKRLYELWEGAARYSLFSDDRDDHRAFRVVISDLVFLGVVQAKLVKKIKGSFVMVLKLSVIVGTDFLNTFL